MENIRERAGSVHVRIGGNTQDFATLVDSIPGGASVEKVGGVSANPVNINILYVTEGLVRCLMAVTLAD